MMIISKKAKQAQRAGSLDSKSPTEAAEKLARASDTATGSSSITGKCQYCIGISPASTSSLV